MHWDILNPFPGTPNNMVVWVLEHRVLHLLRYHLKQKDWNILNDGGHQMWVSGWKSEVGRKQSQPRRILTSGSQEDPRSTAPDEVIQWVVWGVPSLSTEASRHAENGSHGGWNNTDRHPLQHDTNLNTVRGIQRTMRQQI